MFGQLTQWYKNRFEDPNLSALFLLLAFAILIFYFLGNILVPVFVALVLAYLLDWPVNYLVRCRLNRTVATFLVMLLFVSVAIFAFLGVLPTVFKQGAELIKDLPAMFNQIQGYVSTLPAQYPDVIDPNTINQIVVKVRSYILESGGFLLSQSFASLLNIAALIIYAVLVPMMMVFMLKDKTFLIASFVKFLPRNRKLTDQVWVEMNGQIMNYIQGKIIEILIVGGSTYITFLLMDLRYSALLALLVGLSVLIPYIGAAAVTIPVALVALFQWG
ncbi:AI-2E family transporter [Psychromonas sp. MME2]